MNADTSGSYDDLVARANELYDKGDKPFQNQDFEQGGAYFTAAAKVYAAAWKKQATDPGVGTDYAVALFYSGDIPAALKQIDAVLKANPDFQKAWLNKGIFISHEAPAGQAARRHQAGARSSSTRRAARSPRPSPRPQVGRRPAGRLVPHGAGAVGRSQTRDSFAAAGQGHLPAAANPLGEKGPPCAPRAAHGEPGAEQRGPGDHSSDLRYGAVTARAERRGRYAPRPHLGRLALLALVLIGASFYVSPLRDFFQQQDRYEKAAAELQAARQDNTALDREVELLTTKAYIAQRARSDSKLVPPDTQVFVIKGLPGKEEETNFSSATPPTEARSPSSTASRTCGAPCCTEARVSGATARRRRGRRRRRRSARAARRTP